MAYSDTDTYREQLGITYPRLGHALWEPSRVDVGDVGCIRDGKFLRLFNALLPENHPSNLRFGVPDYHEPLIPRVSDHLDRGILKRNHYCSAGVKVAGGPESLSAGPDEWDVSYSSQSRRGGAVLYLPVDAQRQDTLARRDFGRWMIKHIDSWLAFARHLGLGIEQMEEIILVTGCHHTRSWANVTFLEGHTDSQASFKIKEVHDPTVGVRYQFSPLSAQGAMCSWGPEEGLAEDHALFIRGFRVVRPFGVLPKQLRGAAGPNSNLYNDDDDDELPMELIPLPATTTYRDPLRVLSQYIADQAPNCDMVLVHDDDLSLIDGIPMCENIGALQPDNLVGLLQGFQPDIIQHIVSQGEWSSVNASSGETESEATTMAMLSKEFQEWDTRLIVSQNWRASSPDELNLLLPPSPPVCLPIMPIQGLGGIIDFYIPSLHLGNQDLYLNPLISGPLAIRPASHHPRSPTPLPQNSSHHKSLCSDISEMDLSTECGPLEGGLLASLIDDPSQCNTPTSSSTGLVRLFNSFVTENKHLNYWPFRVISTAINRAQHGPTYPWLGHPLRESYSLDVPDVGSIREGNLSYAMHSEGYPSNLMLAVTPSYNRLVPEVLHPLDGGILKCNHYSSEGVDVTGNFNGFSYSYSSKGAQGRFKGDARLSKPCPTPYLALHNSCFTDLSQGYSQPGSSHWKRRSSIRFEPNPWQSEGTSTQILQQSPFYGSLVSDMPWADEEKSQVESQEVIDFNLTTRGEAPVMLLFRDELYGRSSSRNMPRPSTVNYAYRPGQLKNQIQEVSTYNSGPRPAIPASVNDLSCYTTLESPYPVAPSLRLSSSAHPQACPENEDYLQLTEYLTEGLAISPVSDIYVQAAAHTSGDSARSPSASSFTMVANAVIIPPERKEKDSLKRKRQDDKDPDHFNADWELVPRVNSNVPSHKRRYVLGLGACTQCRRLKMKCQILPGEYACKHCKSGSHACIVEPRNTRRPRIDREYLLSQMGQKDVIIESRLKQSCHLVTLSAKHRDIPIARLNRRQFPASSSSAKDRFLPEPRVGKGRSLPDKSDEEQASRKHMQPHPTHGLPVYEHALPGSDMLLEEPTPVSTAAIGPLFSTGINPSRNTTVLTTHTMHKENGANGIFVEFAL